MSGTAFRRSLQRAPLPLAAAGFLCALIGQRLLLQQDATLEQAAGWLAAGALLTLLAFLRPAPERRQETLPAPHTPVRRAFFGVGLALALLGLGLLGWAGWQTYLTWDAIDRSLPLYGLGSLLSCAGFALLDGYRPAAGLRRGWAWCRANARELAGLLAVLALGFAVALIGLNDFPPSGGISWNDEAQMGKDAYAVLHHAARPWQFSTSIYTVVPFFRWLGYTTFALRLPFALMGSLLLLPFYLLARRLFGPGPALAATFLFAVARWRIAFVRLVLPLTPDMLLELAVFACLLRAAQTRGKAPYFLAGLLLSLGMPSHASFKLVPLLALGLLAWAYMRQALAWRRLAASSRPPARALIGGHALGLSFFLAAFLCFSAPYIGFAQRDAGPVFTERFTSIMPALFSSSPVEQEQARTFERIWERVRQVALFFNQSGESWPAMNLPGTPALDPVTGVLFLLGLAAALGFLWRGGNLFLAGWFLIMMIGGGVLTADLRSHRFADAMPAAFLFAGLYVEQIGRRWRAALPGGKWALTAVVGLMLLLAGVLNVGQFYAQQARDPRTRAEFDRDISSIATTIAGFQGSRFTYLFANFPFYHAGQDFAWMAEEPPGRRAMDLGSVLPSREEESGQGAAYIFGWPYTELGLGPAVQAIYPQATERSVTSPYGQYGYHIVTVKWEEVLRRRGLRASYWEADAAQGVPASSGQIAAGQAVFVAGQAPLSTPGVVEWSGGTYIPQFGSYQLWLSGALAAEIWLDERIWPPEGGLLAQGWHTLRVRFNVSALPLSVALRRRSPDGREELVPTEDLATLAYPGLRASFYAEDAWPADLPEQPPVWQRMEPVPAIQGLPSEWGRSPLPELADQPYSVLLQGSLLVEQAGVYDFLVVSQGGSARMQIDGEGLLVDEGASWRNTSAEAQRQLLAGEHAVQLEYRFHEGEYSGVALFWRPPNGEWALIPPPAWGPVGVWDGPQPAQPPAPATATPAPALQPQATPAEAIVGVLTGQRLVERGALPAESRLGRLAGWPTGGLALILEGHAAAIVPAEGGAPTLWGSEWLKEPFALAAGSDGSLYVLDSDRSAIEVFDTQGQRRRTLGEGMGFYSPRGLALGAGDVLYVADTGSNRVVALDTDGNLIRQWGSAGSGRGQLQQPGDLLVDSRGLIYVLDTPVNKRVSIWNAQGQPMETWGLPWASDFGTPGAAFDAESDTFFFTDVDRAELYQYTPAGVLLRHWAGAEWGEQRPTRPVALWAAAGQLYVSDAGQSALLVYDLPR